MGCRVGGVLLLLLGFILFLSAVGTMLGGSSGPDSFGQAKSNMASSMFLAIAAMASFAVGGLLVKIGFVGVAAGIVATETAPAIEHASAAFGRGMRTGGGHVPTLVKVKCRSCGYLESEDARFCSRCAQAV